MALGITAQDGLHGGQAFGHEKNDVVAGGELRESHFHQKSHARPENSNPQQPKRILHIHFDRHGAVPQRQADADHHAEHQHAQVVVNGGESEENEEQSADDPDEVQEGVDGEERRRDDDEDGARSEARGTSSKQRSKWPWRFRGKRTAQGPGPGKRTVPEKPYR